MGPTSKSNCRCSRIIVRVEKEADRLPKTDWIEKGKKQ
jgi:hypothetical protein